MAKDAWSGFLPADYQKRVDDAELKKEMAKILLGSRIPAEGKMVSGHYVKSSPMQHLSNITGQMLGAYMTKNAYNERSAAIGDFQKADRSAVEQAIDSIRPLSTAQTGSGTQGLDGDAGDQPPVMQPRKNARYDAVQNSVKSPYPSVRAWGQAQQKLMEEQWKESAKTSTAKSVAESAGNPEALVQNYYDPLKVIDTAHGGIGEYRDQRGELKTVALPKPTTVTTSVGSRGNVDMLDRRDAELGKERPQVQGAASSLGGLAQAFNMLDSGKINSGALANEITVVRGLASVLGMEVPKDVPATQFLGQTLLPSILNTLLSVAPKGSTSDKELTLAMQYAPTANRDPRALKAMILHTIRGQKALIDDYNSRVENVTRSAGRVPELDPALFKDRSVGYSMGPFSPADVPDEAAFLERLLRTPVQSILNEGVRPGTAPQGGGTNRRLNFRDLTNGQP
jgi:hypothetical protein